MNKILFDFTEPVSYKEFQKNHSESANSSGIYIWGFKSKNGDFISYYVGRRYFTEKSPGSVYSRIISHYKGLTKKGTYMIFSKEFFDNIEEHSKKIPSVAKPYKNFPKELNDLLIYRNDKTFLKEKFNIDPKVYESKNKISLNDLDKMNLDIKRALNTIESCFKEDVLFVSYACPKALQTSKCDFETIKKHIAQAEADTKYKLAELGYHVVSDSKKKDKNYLQLNDINLNALSLKKR